MMRLLNKETKLGILIDGILFHEFTTMTSFTGGVNIALVFSDHSYSCITGRYQCGSALYCSVITEELVVEEGRA